MFDSRFTTVADDVDALLGALDVDDVSDIETLLVVLFSRPISVEEVADGSDDDGSVEVVVWFDDMGYGSRYAFPTSMVELAVACASTIAGLDSTVGAGASAGDGEVDLLTMDDAELISTLQRGLGMVRIYNLMTDE